MTDRLYYRDARLTRFDAHVVRSVEGDAGRFMTVLDQTAFYPTSGGQPFDVGQIGGAAVVDVVDGDAGEVVHVTDGGLSAGSAVRGEIDWGRRFDHMQQHSGQHVLSAAFEHTSSVPTVSFHLGAGGSTIDLAREVTLAEIERAESEANRIVWDDIEVGVRFVDAAEVAALPLRKESTREGTLRLVEIAGFDLSACGGTHVSRTGEIGIVAVSGWERFKAGTRITFRCGKRALDSHRRLRDGAAEAGRLLSVGQAEIGSAIQRMSEEARARDRRLADLQAELVGYRVLEWRGGAETIGPYRGVLRAEPAADGAALKPLVQAAVAGDAGLVVVAAGAGRPTPVVVARSSGIDFDAGVFVKALTSALGGRGGGRAELAQAGVDADAEVVLVTARQLLARSD